MKRLTDRKTSPNRSACPRACGFLVLAVLVGGCQLGGGPSPVQLVRTAGDPEAPADDRRRAKAQIATSSAAAEPVYVDFYRATLADEATDPTLAVVCMRAIAEHGDPADAELIAQQLESGSTYARWQAAVALQRLHAPAVVGPLIRSATEDQDADTRTAASDALGQYPRRDVFDALVDNLDDADAGVSSSARRSLGLMTGVDAGPEPADWLALAQRRGGGLFEQPLAYRYTPYAGPRKFLGLTLFWLDVPTAQPRRPRGYEPPQG